MDWRTSTSPLSETMRPSDRTARGFKVTEGKEAMPFGLYKWLAKYFLSKSQLFEWIYLIYRWNLMCRTNYVAGIKLSRLRWGDDSLTIVIPKTETDQGVS